MLWGFYEWLMNVNFSPFFVGDGYVISYYNVLVWFWDPVGTYSTDFRIGMDSPQKPRISIMNFLVTWFSQLEILLLLVNSINTQPTEGPRLLRIRETARVKCLTPIKQYVKAGMDAEPYPYFQIFNFILLMYPKKYWPKMFSSLVLEKWTLFFYYFSIYLIKEKDGNSVLWF